MPAFNFQKRFAPRVEDGSKRQTIRGLRRDGKNAKKGDPLYLYTGMRTKGCRKLRDAICKDAIPIIIGMGVDEREIATDHVLSWQEKETLAEADGFENATEMFEWFRRTHGLPFTGYLYKW